MKIVNLCCHSITGRHSPFCTRFTVTGKRKKKPVIVIKYRTKTVPLTRRTGGKLVKSLRWGRWREVLGPFASLDEAEKFRVAYRKYQDTNIERETAVFVSGKRVTPEPAP